MKKIMKKWRKKRTIETDEEPIEKKTKQKHDTGTLYSHVITQNIFLSNYFSTHI